MEGKTSSGESNDPNNEKKVSVSGEITVKQDASAINDISNAISQQQAAGNDATNASNRIQSRQANAQERNNTIGWWNFGISSIAFVATVVIIILNYKAINAATNSAKTADSTLNEYKTEFNIINEPILVVGSTIGFSNWYSDTNRPIITIDIHNLSKRAVQIDTCVYGLRYDTAAVMDIFNDRDTNVIIETTKNYVGLEYPFEQKFDGKFIQSRYMINQLKKRINTIFGVIFYKNYINGRRNYYIFSVRIALEKKTKWEDGFQKVIDTYITSNQDSLPKYTCKLFPKVAIYSHVPNSP